jgi:hypothetical protein
VQAALLGQALAAMAVRVAHHRSALIAAQLAVAAVLGAMLFRHQTQVFCVAAMVVLVAAEI